MSPISTWVFVLTVVRLGHRFLLVHEEKGGGTWSLPGGRVAQGETLTHAAKRLTHADTGLSVVLEGVLRIEYTPAQEGSTRLRVVFVGRPKDDTPPKSRPDENSLEAAWCTLDEMRQLPLRGAEIWELCSGVASGAPIHPLSLLASETAPAQ